MKHNRWTVFVASFVAVCIASQTFAQQQPTPPPLPYQVAIVDVAQLIKRHPDFRTKQKALQEEMFVKEAHFKKKQEDINAKEKALAANYKQGTPEFQKLADEIQNDYIDFEKEAKAEQRRFALKNSHIMYDTYKDIKTNIAAFAARARIAQVTDFRMFEPDPAIPQTVAEDMDQKLVWFAPELDITGRILQQLCDARGVPVPPMDETVGPPAAATAAAPPQPGAGQPGLR